jgi:hypothetical protein
MRTLGRIGGCLLIAAAGLAVPLQGVAQAQAGKLVVIVMENETYANIVGNPQAPYLNQLIAQGRLFTNYAGVANGSNPNYLAMTSGLTLAQSPPAPNIFQAIDGSGGALAWKEFMESMPGNCAQGTRVDVPGTSVPLYTADHDPDYQYRSSTSCAANDVPMTSSTFNPANLPDLSYVVPNECDDMHTLPGSGQACPAYFGSNPGTSLVNMGDNWLASVVPSLLAQPNVTVLITWDEGSMSTTPPEHVMAVEAGAGVTPGSTDGTAYTHYGLEAGLYGYFGLGTAPGYGATATPLPIPSPAGASPAISSFTPSSGPAGATVTINGGALTGATAVTFNGLAASFTVNSDSEVTATVPAGATSGPIAVTTPAGTGTSQDSFTVTSGGPSPPAAPTGLTAAPSGSTVSLSWSDSDTSVSYQLERSNEPGFGTYTSVSLPAGTTSYNDTGLSSAVYYYRLSALNSGGQSPYATASAATISYAALVAGRPGLQDQWRLGEASGTTANDSAGSYNGTYVNGPGLGSPGAIANDPNTSVTLNGTSQRVTLASLPPAGDFSIEGWTYLTNGSVTNNTLYGGSGTVRLLARPGTGPTAAYAGVTLNGTEYVLQPLNPVSNLNTWVYWVLTRQGSTLTLYRDGVQIAQRTDLPATAAANISGYIGSQTNGLYYLNGRTDDVAIYSSALSPSTITSHYQAALSGPAPS